MPKFRAGAYRIYSRWLLGNDRSAKSVYNAIHQAYEAGAAVSTEPAGRIQCTKCARSGGELTENGCPSCGPRAEVRFVATGSYPSGGDAR